MNTPNETDNMIIDSINNLSAYRFLLADEEFRFDLVSLTVSNYSQYLRQLKNNNKETNWSKSNLLSLLDDKYSSEIDRFSLLDYNSDFRANSLWNEFRKAVNFYTKKKFSYKIDVWPNKHIQYNEYVDEGANLIKDILFDDVKSYYILTFLNKNITTEQLLLNSISNKHGAPQDGLSDILKTLIEQGLVLMDKAGNLTSIVDIH